MAPEAGRVAARRHVHCFILSDLISHWHLIARLGFVLYDWKISWGSGNLIWKGADSEGFDNTWANGTHLGLSLRFIVFSKLVSWALAAAAAEANYCHGRSIGWSMMEMPHKILFSLCLLPLTLEIYGICWFLICRAALPCPRHH
jgi:hypothetical protein